MKLLPILLIAASLTGVSGAFAEGDAPFPLQDFVMVPRGLASAIVMDTHGNTIGIVNAISTARSGNPVALDILLADGRQMTIASRMASYDPVANHVITPAFDIQLADARR